MMSLSRAVRAEALKLKRSLAARLAVAAPLTVVLLNFFAYTRGRGGESAGGNPLIGFAQINFTMWTILVLPLYVALTAALIAAVDHQTDGWKQMLALPVSRTSVFAAKWIATAGLILFSALIFAAAIGLAAGLLQIVRAPLRASPIPMGLIIVRSVQTFAAGTLIVSIQTWVSLRYRTFIAGLGVGIVGVLLLLGGVARSGLGTVMVYIYPWALPPTAMARMWEAHPDRWPVAAGGLAAAILVATVGCWHLSSRE